MSFLQKHHRLIFYAAWLFLGLAQSGLTELQDDEAYYWVYSQYPAWGYFDHPPMIAVLIKAGYALFPNELGVRLFPLVINLFSLIIIEKLLDKKNPLLFYCIALSLAVIQLSGFMAVPDTPLLFFTALFFLCYKKFQARASLVNTLLLGLVMALLLYTKYHAVLIIVFTLLSNLKLLTHTKIYVAGMVALLLFLPHLYWQYQHDWISFRYHLFESNVNPYKPGFTFNYLLGQLLLPGPIAGFILLPAALLYRPGDETEKALRFTMIAIYIFFLLGSFRGKTELNWTFPVLVPLIVLSHQFLADKNSWQKWLYRLLPVTLLLVLFARVVMIEDILQVKAIQKRYHAWKKWPAEMKGKTKGLPVVFSNSYQRASKYWFYSGQVTYSQNLYKEHRNNYNFWPIEYSLLGKPVYYMDIYDRWKFPDSVKTPIGWVGYRYDSSLASFAKVDIQPVDRKLTINRGDSLRLEATASMPLAYKDYILQHPECPVMIYIAVFGKKGWKKDYETNLTLTNLLKSPFSVIIDPQLPAGKYQLLFAIGVDGYHPTHNSRKFELMIK